MKRLETLAPNKNGMTEINDETVNACIWPYTKIILFPCRKPDKLDSRGSKSCGTK